MPNTSQHVFFVIISLQHVKMEDQDEMYLRLKIIPFGIKLYLKYGAEQTLSTSNAMKWNIYGNLNDNKMQIHSKLIKNPFIAIKVAFSD